MPSATPRLKPRGSILNAVTLEDPGLNVLVRRPTTSGAPPRAQPEVEWLDACLTRQRLGLLDLTMCEVLQGLENDAKAARVSRELRKFAVFNTGGIELAEAAARNYRVLRSRGRTVRTTTDCLIATFCLMEGHSLLQCDRDFDAFEAQLGLRVVHPERPARRE